jgi:two-component system nitrogen regulation response regulator GlnG/two-component system response regulator HydG
MAPNISRHQLELEPLHGGLQVSNVGRCALRHNGNPVQSAVVQAGDTLTLEDTLVLLVETRHVLWPELVEPRLAFPFGEADVCGIVGESESVWRLRHQLVRAAQSEAHVIIHGPSGAGKELAGRAIHHLSQRSRGPLVARNAATFPETLIDAELFGCEKNYPNVGAPARAGLIAEAHEGTLLLDEMGELPEAQQTHLLRVLDSGGEYQTLGDPRPRRSNLRVVGMTNRPLDEMRPDFLARFAVRIEVLDLAQRLSDVPLLMRGLWQRIVEQQPALRDRFLPTGLASFEPLTEPRLVESLLRHIYIHNTRELERLLRIASSSSEGRFVAATSEFEAELRFTAPEAQAQDLEIDRETIEGALEGAGGSPTRAAAALGLRNRHVLYRLMKKHGL